MRTKSAQKGAASPRGVRRKRRASLITPSADHTRDPSQLLEPTPTPQKRRRHSKNLSVDTDRSLELQSENGADDLDDTRLSVRPNVRFSSVGPPSTQSVRAWTPPSSSPVVFTEQQFTPLRAKLDPRTRRRLRRSHLSEEMNELYEHDRRDARDHDELVQLRKQMREKNEQIEKLTADLEEASHRAIAVGQDNEETSEQLQNMATELEKLKREQQELVDSRDQMGYDTDFTEMVNDVDFEENDIMTQDTVVQRSPLDTQRSSVSPPDSVINRSFYITNTTTTGFGEASTQVALPDIDHAKEIKLYEKQLDSLLHNIADLQADITKTNFALQGLGFTVEGSDSVSMTTALSKNFMFARTEMDSLLPGLSTASVENAQLFKTLLDHVKNLKAELNEKVDHLKAYQDRNENLAEANRTVLQSVTKLEARNEHLEAQWYEMDVDRETKERKLLDYEQQLAKLTDTVTTRDSELVERTQIEEALQADLDDKDVALDRITKAMERYRDEAEKYAKTIERLQQQHEELVSGLTEKLEEATSRGDDLAEEITEKQAFVKILETRISYTEARLEDLQDDMDRLNNLKESECRQRQLAETELDDANSQLADRDEQLRQSGQREQELRSKLFEVQMSKQSAVDDLNELVAARDERYQLDMAAEMECREKAEALVKDLASQVDDLQTQLDQALLEKDELQVERDELADKLQAELERFQEKCAQLEKLDLKLAETKQKNAAQVHELQSEIAELTDVLAAHQTTIDTMKKEAIETATANQAVIDEQDERINNLEHQLYDANQGIRDLEEQKSELETNVELRISQANELQEQHDLETTDLNDIIATHFGTITELTNAATARELEFESILANKDQEFMLMAEIAETRDATNKALLAQLEDLRRRFDAVVEDGKETTQAQVREIEAALMRVKERSDSFMDRAGKEETAVHEYAATVIVTPPQDVVVPVVTQTTKIVEEKKIGWTKMKSRGRKRRSGIWGDSALGVASSSDIDEAIPA